MMQTIKTLQIVSVPLTFRTILIDNNPVIGCDIGHTIDVLGRLIFSTNNGDLNIRGRGDICALLLDEQLTYICEELSQKISISKDGWLKIKKAFEPSKQKFKVIDNRISFSDDVMIGKI